MPDNQTTTVINAVDNTGAALKSAARGFSDLERNLQSVARRTGELYSPEEWKKRTDAFVRWNTQLNSGTRKQTEEIKNQVREQREHSGVLAQVGEELTGMASRYLAVGAAIEKTREGFLEFSKDQEILRVAGARMGAAHEQLEKFKETAEKIGHTFGDSFEKASQTMEAFREAAYLTASDMDKIKGVAPAIMEISHRFGVDSVEMGQAFGSFVRQMNIAPTQWEQALGAMGVIAKDLNLDFGQLNRYAPQLTEAMSQLGATGTSGMNQVLTLLAMTRKQFGNTTLAARALTQYLDQIQRGGGVAQALGMDPAQWTQRTDQIKASGGNLFDYYMSKIKETRALGYQWGELFDDPKQRQFWKMMLDGGGEYNKLIAQITKDSSEFHAGNTKDLENEAMQLKRLIYEWNEFWKALGGAASALGASKALINVTTELRSISELIDRITNAIHGKGKFTDLLPSLKDLRLPSFGEVISGMANGPAGPPEGGNPEHRAHGGPVRAGRSYKVGERGAELFTPNTSGSITSSYTLDRVEKHTDDSNALLTQIRDLLLKEDQEREKARGGGGGGDIGAGAGTNPMGGLGAGGDGSGGVDSSGRVRGLTRGMARRLNSEGQGIAAADTSNINGSDYLVGERSGMKAEIDKDPNLRRELRGMMQTEGTPLPSLESLANRTAYINAKRAKQGKKPLSLRQMLHSGFYGPINRGALPGAMRATDRNPQKYDAAIDAVFSKGSNILEGATDQGMPSDPNGRTAIGGFRKKFGGNVFNDWGGGGSPADAARWRLEQQRRVRSSPTTTPAEVVPVPTPRPSQDSNTPMSALEEARKMRAELEQPITIRAQLDRGQDSQFRRASMRREVNREVREASWQSYNDIGAAIFAFTAIGLEPMLHILTSGDVSWLGIITSMVS